MAERSFRLYLPANPDKAALIRLLEAVKQYSIKPLTITIEPYKKQRSSNQNRFMHGVFLPALQDMFADCGEIVTPEVAKEYFKRNFGVWVQLKLPNGDIDEVPKSTARYSTIECEMAMEKARAWAAGFGYRLPFPNESASKLNQ